MNVHCFELDASRKLKPADPDEALSRWLAGEGTYWIDVDTYQPAELEPWLERLNLPPLLAQQCLKVGEATQIIPLREVAFLEVVVFADTGFTRLASVGVLCLKNLLITLHPQAIDIFEQSRRAFAEFELLESTTSDLLAALLLLKTNEAAKVGRVIRATLDDMDRRMITIPVP